jgi:SIR2-like domain
MPYFLLTGAGFKRNWGGWLAEEAFEFLLGEVEHDEDLRKYLWKARDEGLGFEAALAHLQASYERKFDAQVEHDLRNLTSAVFRMFAAMGRGFHSGEFEFQKSHVNRSVAFFLAQFDALFTLNQDTLLEERYFRSVPDRFVDCHTPGLVGTYYLLTIGRTVDPYFSLKTPDKAHFSLIPNLQPYFKLHGSIDWLYESEMLLILGGGKKENIGKHPLLQWYHDSFSRLIASPGARVMIVGYGFRDVHINDMLVAAARGGTKFFIIDYNGTDAIKPGKSAFLQDEYETFRSNIIGASRRPLVEIFGDVSSGEFGKFDNFFGYSLLHRKPRSDELR